MGGEMKKILITALLTAFVAAPAIAADNFVAVDLGRANYSNAKVTGPAANQSYDDPGFFRIAFGHNFTPNLGVEAGFSTFGDSEVIFSNATTTLKVSVFQVAAVSTYPLNDSFAVFGKLGAAGISAKESGTGAAASLHGSDTTTNLMFGFGCQLNISREWGMRLQYEDFGKARYTPSVFGVTQPEAKIGVTVFSIGVVYNF
jgi:OOP family OmpA-OmpF porin